MVLSQKLAAVAALLLLPLLSFPGKAASPEILNRTIAVKHGGYFPVLVRLRNGDLLAVLRGGAPHIGIKGRLDVIRSRDNGKTWSAPKTVVDGPLDDRNPALGQMPNGDLVLAYAVLEDYDSSGLKLAEGPKPPKFTGVFVTRSSDNGNTWIKPELDRATHALQDGTAAISPYGKIVTTSDGTALLSVYYGFAAPRGNEDYVFRSRDNGKTWSEPVLIGKHFNETGLAVLHSGRVLAALRFETGGHLAIAASDDEGKSWSEPKQVTADREHPGDLIELSDHRVLLSFGERNRPMGIKALLSGDGGRTWAPDGGMPLTDDAPVSDSGYPSSVQLPDGRIVTIYYQVNDPKNVPASTEARSIVWSVRKE